MRSGIIILGTLFFVSCDKPSETTSAVPVMASEHVVPEWKKHGHLTFEIIQEWPHDQSAFTQGLFFSQGQWVESTGGHGSTWLRRVEKATGRVLQEKELLDAYFGEGVTELNGRIYQLTWQNQVGFVYDAKTMEWQKNFSYQGEGWGLTTDEKVLIMSNGSEKLRFLDPQNFRVLREISVRDQGQVVTNLNELEWVEGEIFANVWMRDEIVRIDPQNGNVLGRIDLRGLSQLQSASNPNHVLNGIAYDSERKELFVTGKCWSKIYQIRLIKKQ